MSSLEEAREMLRKAEEAEKRARIALTEARRDKERAEEIIAESAPVSEQLRERREVNHFTQLFENAFRGKLT
jgi:hypothetical protein